LGKLLSTAGTPGGRADWLGLLKKETGHQKPAGMEWKSQDEWPQGPRDLVPHRNGEAGGVGRGYRGQLGSGQKWK